MKTLVAVLFATVLSLAIAQAEEKQEDKSLGEKTSETLDKAGNTVKKGGRAVVDTTKRAADAVVDAVTPQAGARKVNVTLTEHRIAMPKQLKPGKTAFIVKNAGNEKHNFAIKGEGLDQKFLAAVDPKQTKVLHANLKAGKYEVICPVKDHDDKGMKVNLARALTGAHSRADLPCNVGAALFAVSRRCTMSCTTLSASWRVYAVVR